MQADNIRQKYHINGDMIFCTTLALDGMKYV